MLQVMESNTNAMKKEKVDREKERDGQRDRGKSPQREVGRESLHRHGESCKNTQQVK